MGSEKTQDNKRIRNPKGREGEPISLYPLSFEEALSDALQVKPPPREKAPRKKAQRRKMEPSQG